MTNSERVKFATWNAQNAFEDDDRFQDAFTVIEQIDADVISIPETIKRGPKEDTRRQERERLSAVEARMATLGYMGKFTDYVPAMYPNDRNAHYLSMWVRPSGIRGYGDMRIRNFGDRNGIVLWVPKLESTYVAAHLSDVDPLRRKMSILGMLGSRSENRRFPDAEMMVGGDLNEMHRRDPKSLLPRLIGRMVTDLEVKDYYNTRKPFQRFMGKVIRTCRMASGEGLEEFEAENFHDADPSMQATIGGKFMAFQLDHFFGGPQISFSDFVVHSREVDGRVVSDHSPISVYATRRGNASSLI